MNETYQDLRIWAEMFHDAQLHRIAATNRVERAGIYVDPEAPGLWTPHLDGLKKTEHECELELHRIYRKVVPAELVAWQRSQLGLGEHLFARLLGHLGHPIHATPYFWEGAGEKRKLVAAEPFERTIGQLWAYCGVGDPERKRKKGMTVEEALACGVPQLKMLLWNLANACMKQKGKGAYFRDQVYEKARARFESRAHLTPCVRCGPSGKPAPPGSPWSAAHQHNSALRIVSKEILREMWIVCYEAEK